MQELSTAFSTSLLLENRWKIWKQTLSYDENRCEHLAKDRHCTKNYRNRLSLQKSPHENLGFHTKTKSTNIILTPFKDKLNEKLQKPLLKKKKHYTKTLATFHDRTHENLGFHTKTKSTKTSLHHSKTNWTARKTFWYCHSHNNWGSVSGFSKVFR